MSVGMPTSRLGDGSQEPGVGVNAAKMMATIKKGQYAYYNGDRQPMLSAANGYSNPAGTTGTLAKAIFSGPFPLVMDYFALGAGQTLLGPLLNTSGKGLEVTGDQTVDEGYEYVFGTVDTRGPFVWTVGTHNAFVRVKFTIEDVSDLDEAILGLRKLETLQASKDDYDEAAWISSVNGDVKISTILNGGATDTDDTGEDWADNETHEFKIELVGRSVSFFLDGDPLVDADGTFQFDNGEVVMPFFRTLLDDTGPADATSLLWWKEVEVGLLQHVTSNGRSGRSA